MQAIAVARGPGLRVFLIKVARLHLKSSAPTPTKMDDPTKKKKEEEGGGSRHPYKGPPTCPPVIRAFSPAENAADGGGGMLQFWCGKSVQYVFYNAV